MGYMHITNLYAFQNLMTDPAFADGCYALEKIHGTSAHEFRIQDTPNVVRAMRDDILREEGQEFVWSDEASKEIGRRTAQLYKARIQKGQPA